MPASHYLTSFSVFAQTREVIAIAARYGMASEQPIHGSAKRAGHFIFTTHCYVSAGCGSRQLPALEAAHAVRVLKSPFEYAVPFVASDDGGVRHFFLAEFSADSHFLRDGKIRRATGNFKLGFHFGAIPVGHALR